MSISNIAMESPQIGGARAKTTHGAFFFVRLVCLFVATPFVAALSLRAAEVEGLPKAGEPHPAQIAKSQEKTLACGLRVIVVERPGLPLVSAELLVIRGAETDPPRLAGLAHFTANLLKLGTATRSAQKIAEDTEALGAKIETEAAWDATAVKLTALSSNTEPALGIVADLVRHPAFAKEEIERLRRETLDELILNLEQPGHVAKYAASRATLGAAPYGHPEAGTPASITRIARKDITALHDAGYSPGNSLLIMAGNITAPEAFAMAGKVFGDWKATSADLKTSDTPAPVAGRAILINMPNAGQAAVYLAAPGIERSGQDWFAGKVTNALLGGGYSSRLNQEVRVKRGLSYGAASSLSTWRTSGLFMAGAQTKNESATEVIKLIQAEIERLSKEPVPEDYLKTRQSLLTGAFSRDLETNEGYVKRIGELALYGMDEKMLGSYVASVAHTTPDDLKTFAEKHFAAGNFTVIVAGQAAIVEKPLRALFPKLEVIPLSKLDLDSPALKSAAKGK